MSIRLEPQQILESDQTTGDSFRVLGGDYWVTVTEHAGGTWNLQFRSPYRGSDGTVENWHNLGIEFDDNDAVFWKASPHYDYRITGGSEGARAWVSDTIFRGSL